MKEQKIEKNEALAMGKAVNHEVIILSTLMLACDTIVFDIERRMKAVNPAYHLKHETKLRMRQYLDILAKAETHFENFISPSILKIGEGGGFSDYETLRVYSQEIIRLLMLYYEKCNDRDKHISVFNFIANLEGGKDVFTVEDINRFDLGCKNE